MLRLLKTRYNLKNLIEDLFFFNIMRNLKLNPISYFLKLDLKKNTTAYLISINFKSPKSSRSSIITSISDFGTPASSAISEIV